jgi:hypothetical protein
MTVRTRASSQWLSIPTPLDVRPSSHGRECHKRMKCRQSILHHHETTLQAGLPLRRIEMSCVTTDRLLQDQRPRSANQVLRLSLRVSQKPVHISLIRRRVAHPCALPLARALLPRLLLLQSVVRRRGRNVRKCQRSIPALSRLDGVRASSYKKFPRRRRLAPEVIWARRTSHQAWCPPSMLRIGIMK